MHSKYNTQTQIGPKTNRLSQLWKEMTSLLNITIWSSKIKSYINDKFIKHKVRLLYTKQFKQLAIIRKSKKKKILQKYLKLFYTDLNNYTLAALKGAFW